MKRISSKTLVCCLSLTFILSASVLVFASETKKWGEAGDEFLNMKVYPEDTSAAAVKIFDVGEIELSLTTKVNLRFRRHYQIKILKPSGKSYADVAIPYWHEDKITRVKAQTIQSNGKKLKVKKVHDEEEKDNYRLKKFSLPAVEVGSIIEVEYEFRSKYFTFLEPWVFQDEIPTKEANLHGKTKVLSAGYASNRCHRQLEEDKKVFDFVSNQFGDGLDEYEVISADTTITPAARDTFELAFEFELRDFAEMIDDEIYLRPALYSCMDKNIFVSEKREFPIEFGFNAEHTELNVYAIPESYEIVELPENVIIQNDYFVYRRMIFRISGASDFEAFAVKRKRRL